MDISRQNPLSEKPKITISINNYIVYVDKKLLISFSSNCLIIYYMDSYLFVPILYCQMVLKFVCTKIYNFIPQILQTYYILRGKI